MLVCPLEPIVTIDSIVSYYSVNSLTKYYKHIIKKSKIVKSKNVK